MKDVTSLQRDSRRMRRKWTLSHTTNMGHERADTLTPEGTDSHLTGLGLGLPYPGSGQEHIIG